MARDMTADEWKAFVSEGTRTGKVAVVRSDGSPHVTPVWMVLDGDTLIFTTWHETVKASWIRRDGRVCVCFDDQQPPFSFVTIEGTAEFLDDPDARMTWSTRIGARYMGADRAEEFGRRNSIEGEMLVRLTPSRVIAVKDMSG